MSALQRENALVSIILRSSLSFGHHHLNPKQFTHIDPFSDPVGTYRSFIRAVLATAAFRCWVGLSTSPMNLCVSDQTECQYLILFFSGWATAVCLISDKVHHVGVQPTILTVYVLPAESFPVVSYAVSNRAQPGYCARFRYLL